MTTTYTFDVFSSLDGYGAYQPPGDWGGYFGKEGPEFLERRLGQYAEPQRMVFGATWMRDLVEMLADDEVVQQVQGTWLGSMRELPTTVLSSTLTEPLAWPDATIESGDAVEAVRRLKEESDVPLRSHGSLKLNWALMAAGLVDRVQVTVFPLVAGATGIYPVFGGAGDFDLELLEATTLDGHTQELVYKPTVRTFSQG